MTATIFKPAFDNYIKSVFQIEVDLRFWKHFLTNFIEKYKLENPINRWINEAGFSLYNIKPDGSNTWLHVSNETNSIEIKDLDIYRDNFFTWVMNLSIIRIYNSIELLLLEAIQIKHFPTLASPARGKKEANRVIAEMKNFLKVNDLNSDTTNNRYMIEFIKLKSPDFVRFLEVRVNVDWDTTWNQFFELFSVLRNIITHHAMIVTKDIRNNLNSIAKDVYRHYFIQAADKSEEQLLEAKDEHYFLNLISQVNDFAVNTVKFIAGEKDFVFIGLHKA